MFGPMKFKNQDYDEIKSDCVAATKLFQDDQFPADDSALIGLSLPGTVEWKRPQEVNATGKFHSLATASIVMTRGVHASPTMTAVMTSLTVHQSIFRNTVPDADAQCWHSNSSEQNLALALEGKQPLCTQRYCGLFKFHFWQTGEWIEVIVDDLLPTADGTLLFTGELQGHFWPALLEKAYAKLLGGYSMIQKQSATEIWVDFTGGLCNEIKAESVTTGAPNEKVAELYRFLRDYAARGRSVLWGMTAQNLSDELGLKKNAIYIVTAAKELSFATGLFRSNTVQVVRMRNPWHMEGEWKGAYGDMSREVHDMDKAQRKKVGITYKTEDEFYMKLTDFHSHFESFIVCSVGSPDQQFSGEMTTENAFDTAECMNPSTFFCNPQFLISARDPSGLTLLIQVTQNAFIPPSLNVAYEKWLESTTTASVSVVATPTDRNRAFRIHRLTELEKRSMIAPKPIRSRSAVISVKLPRKGRYVITPYIVKEIFLDGLSSREVHIKLYNVENKSYTCEQLIDDQPWMAPRWLFCLRNAQLLTRITVKKAFIKNEDRDLNAVDCTLSFVVQVHCEGDNAETTVATGSLEPEWNESVVFYRKRPETFPISFKVFTYRPFLPNMLIGEATVFNLNECPDVEIVSDLYRMLSAKEAKQVSQPATEASDATTSDAKVMLKSSLTISMASSADLTYF